MFAFLTGDQQDAVLHGLEKNKIELESVAEKLGLQLRTVEGYTRQGGGPFGADKKMIDAVFTDRIVLTGRGQSFRQSVGVVSDVPWVRVLEPQTAFVTVEIAAAPPEEVTEPATKGPAKSKTSKGGAK